MTKLTLFMLRIGIILNIPSPFRCLPIYMFFKFLIKKKLHHACKVPGTVPDAEQQLHRDCSLKLKLRIQLRGCRILSFLIRL